MKTHYYLIALISLLSFTCLAQNSNQQNKTKDYSNYPYWIEMMQDQNANYYETVDAFNAYWENHEITKGSGYNIFKRWEWATRFHINSDGSRMPVGYIRDQLNLYHESYAKASEFEGEWTNITQNFVPETGDIWIGKGRLNALAFHPTDANVIYVGAPAGGLWVSENKGQSWNVLTDDLPTLGVSSIIIDFNDPNIIYLGSGDRDKDNNDSPGLGVFKSTDGGNSWVEKNSGMGDVTVGRMIQHPENPLTLFAATSGGIFKSTDSANTWIQTKSGNIKEIVFKPDNPSILYSSGNGSFYKSSDSGDSWETINSGLPSNAYRAVIGVSEANPNYVYFLATHQLSFMGLYQSVDAGETFVTQSTTPNIMGRDCIGDTGGQPWYDLDITVDPFNSDIIFAGGINTWKSIDGGMTWFITANDRGECGTDLVYSDLHVLEWNPVDGNLYAGTDGGIWWTDDSGTTWNSIIDGLAIGQLYKLGQSRLNNNNTITGLQDIGINTSTADGLVSSGVFADGMEVAIDINDSTLSYGCSQYGRMYRLVDGKNPYTIGGEGINGITEAGAWVTPFTQHESNHNIMYAGYDNLWRTENLWDEDPSWENITNGQGNGLINVVEHSSADVDLLYFTTGSGNFLVSENIESPDPQFINLSARLPNTGQIVTDIEAHPFNPNIVYITQSQKVYKSLDKGQTWEDISGSLPDVNMYDLAFYNRNGIEGLYVGSNMGVFFKDENMDDWIHFSEGLPAAIWVSEIEIYYHPTDVSKDMIRASTYGRGLWESSPYYYASSADFYAKDTILPTGCSIDFFDLSNGYPHNWSWTFEGGNPATSSDSNPVSIQYNEPGTFEVTLTVTNPAGNNSKTITDYITVEEGLLPQVDFTSDVTTFCAPGVAQFYDLSQGCPSAWLWEVEPQSFTFLDGTDAQSQNPVIEFLESVTYTIKLTASNVNGSSELTIDNYIDPGGYAPYYLETFEELFLDGSGWEVENPDNEFTWELFQVQGTEPGNFAAGVDFSSNQIIGERDRLISPPMNLTEVGTAWLSFEHAYAKKFDAFTDSLIIYISADCGSSWSRIFATGEDGEGSFATHEQTEAFWPENSSDWCMSGWGASCYNIDLAQWVGNSDVKIAFETYSYFGNPIFIDNVTIGQYVGEEEITSHKDDIRIYPNPTTNQLTIKGIPINSEFQLTDLTGNVLMTQKAVNNSTTLNISELPKGIYLIRSSNGVKKIVKM